VDTSIGTACSNSPEPRVRKPSRGRIHMAHASMKAIPIIRRAAGFFLKGSLRNGSSTNERADELAAQWASYSKSFASACRREETSPEIVIMKKRSSQIDSRRNLCLNFKLSIGPPELTYYCIVWAGFFLAV
jgi:hypothetical protein